MLLPLGLAAQTLLSPSKFLGYELGERFTPHHRVIAYFEHAASVSPKIMQWFSYGNTYEGRPLNYAVVSSPANIERIESIRKNNLRLAGMVSDEPGKPDQPVVVWLSYNVHGNEASSTEVSMQMLYELISGSNTSVNGWLKNTVVIIDPCLNPDGRDRYVNWINQVIGSRPNANINSREHDEPWPQGRTNHYYFDLNRDWAWQSQIETRARVKAYHSWMPAIHVDFHEQYYNSPYYFAPAAEPFHEVITPFQREFQHVIGKNHARYFDERGWLYFTREYFDLFYPAYGDTYPIYNGAIGMTYEQAGHSMAGVSIATGEDTLTLKDRIDHHLTTGLSTLEIASENFRKVNAEFEKYFDEGKRLGSGTYKTYIIKDAGAGKMNMLRDFFVRNRIEFGYPSSAGKAKGFNYFTGKNEQFNYDRKDLMVSTYQPKAALVRVLFEPESKLSDSMTYDITAWALPYAYGMQSYALTEKMVPAKSDRAPDTSAMVSNAYAYLVNYSSFEDARFLAAVMKAGFKVRIAESSFTYKGRPYNAGTLIILKNANADKIDQLPPIAGKFSIEMSAIESGFMDAGVDMGSEKIRIMRKPRVGLLAGEGLNQHAVGEVWHLFDQELDFPITVFSSGDPGKVSLKDVDVLIMADGYYSSLSDKDGNAELKSWVKNGGKVIAIGSAAAQMSEGGWGFTKKKENAEEVKDEYANLKKYADRDRAGLSDHIPGAIYKTELDNTHPLGYGYPNFYFTLKLNPTIYEFVKDGWNVGVLKKERQVAGFVGDRLHSRIKDGTTIGVVPLGKGSVVFFSDDPIFRSFWESGKLMFFNSVFLAGN